MRLPRAPLLHRLLPVGGLAHLEPERLEQCDEQTPVVRRIIRDEQPEARLPRRERYRPARRGWRRVLRRVRQFNAEVAGERRALPDRAADAQIAAHQLRELPADG